MLGTNEILGSTKKVYKWNVSYWYYVDIYFHWEVYNVISVFLEVRKTADIFKVTVYLQSRLTPTFRSAFRLNWGPKTLNQIDAY